MAEEGVLSCGGKVFKQQGKFKEIHTAVTMHTGCKEMVSLSKNMSDGEEKEKLKKLSKEEKEKAKVLIKELDVSEGILLTDLSEILTARFVEAELKKKGQGHTQCQWYDGVQPGEDDEDDLDWFFKMKHNSISMFKLTLLPINNNNN